MIHLRFARAAALAISVAAFAAACSTRVERSPAPVYDASEWSANGYLAPGPTGAPELIGQYATRAACEAAAAEWMSRQVVGHPVFAECLPISRH